MAADNAYRALAEQAGWELNPPHLQKEVPSEPPESFDATLSALSDFQEAACAVRVASASDCVQDVKYVGQHAVLVPRLGDLLTGVEIDLGDAAMLEVLMVNSATGAVHCLHRTRVQASERPVWIQLGQRASQIRRSSGRALTGILTVSLYATPVYLRLFNRRMLRVRHVLLEHSLRVRHGEAGYLELLGMRAKYKVAGGSPRPWPAEVVCRAETEIDLTPDERVSIQPPEEPKCLLL